MVLLQPTDVRLDSRWSALDATLIAIDHCSSRGNRALGIIEEQHHVNMQRGPVRFQRLRVVTALLDYLLGNIAL